MSKKFIFGGFRFVLRSGISALMIGSSSLLLIMNVPGRTPVFIRDVLTCDKHRVYKDVFCIEKQDITEVSLMGTIIDIERRGSTIRYSVDDGTGVISCILDEHCPLWVYKAEVCRIYEEHLDLWENNVPDNRLMMREKVQPMKDLLDEMGSMSLGQCVLVNGRLLTFSDRPEDADKRFVMILCITPVKDVREEIAFFKIVAQKKALCNTSHNA